MIVSTTSTIDGRPIQAYLGVASGEAIMGANVLKDFSAGIRDLVGGRTGSYEKVISRAREIALNELIDQATDLGANAIVGIDVDYESLERGKEKNSNMLMVSVSGTAVRIAE